MQGRQPRRGAWPVARDGIRPGAAQDSPEDDRHDNGVIGVADDRDEVGNQVDGANR